MPHRLITIILIAAMGYHTAASADAPASAVDPGAPMFLFGGFGTFGVVHSSEDPADFTSTLFNPTVQVSPTGGALTSTV
jgi:hypothetical protein